MMNKEDCSLKTETHQHQQLHTTPPPTHQNIHLNTHPNHTYLSLLSFDRNGIFIFSDVVELTVN